MNNLNTLNTEVNWKSVHQESQNNEYNARFMDALNYSQVAIDIIKRDHHIETSEMAETMIKVIISQVVADLMPMCGLQKSPVIVPLALEPDNTAFAYKSDEGVWFLGLNTNIIAEALSSQQSHDHENVVSADNKNAKLVYGLAHEMGHMRQKEVLGMTSQEAIPFAPEVAAELVERHGDEIGNRMIEQYQYETRVEETHANAFAVRYINAKKRDPNVSSFWKNLDIHNEQEVKWSGITNALFLKKMTTFLQLAKDTSNGLVEREDGLRRLGILKSSLKSYESVRNNGIDKILSMLH